MTTDKRPEAIKQFLALVTAPDKMEQMLAVLKQGFALLSDLKQLKASVDAGRMEIDSKLRTIRSGEDYILTDADKKEIAAMIDVPVVEKVIEKELKTIVKEQPIAITRNVYDPKVAKDVSRLDKRMTDIERKPFGFSRNWRTIKKDVSDQCDGSRTTFSIGGTHFGIVGVFGTQFPQVYRPVIDYTETATGITLTSQVSPPQTGQTLIIQYIK